MATHLDINHDSGPPVSAHWTTLQAGVGFSITAASAMNGTANGLEIDEDTTAGYTLRQNTTPPASNQARLRVYFDPNGVTRPNASTYIMTTVLATSATGNAFSLEFVVNAAGDQYTVQGRAQNDSAGSTNTAAVTLTDGPHCVEIAFTRSSGVFTSDGAISLYVDGVLQSGPITGQLFTAYNAISFLQATAAVAPSAGVSGQFYLDEVLIDDDDDAILCIAVFTPTLAPMTKPVDIDADGSNLYLALLDSGNPILIKMSTALDADGSTVFEPGAGDDIGVQCGRFDADVVWVAGAFDGTNVVEKSEDGGTIFTVKDPGTFGDVEAFVVGPDSDIRVLIADDNIDVQETLDDGTTWTAINSGTGFNVNAIARLDKNVQESVFGNDAGANDNIDFSPNSGGDMEDFSAGFPTEDATRVIVN